MSLSIDEFVQSLTDTGILPAEEVTSLVSSLPEDRRGIDVEKIARELVRQQKLTRFQASVIFRRQSRGLRFGDYIVLDKIGSGGMGQVFKAENRRTHQIVALKLLRATFTKSERAVTRFYREANTSAMLKHRNLVSVAEAGEWNGLHFLVMELIDGRDVRSIIKEKGPFPVSQAVDIALQAARGLDYAHQNGIVHRDIKPANLLLDKKGRTVVLDLGLARLDDSALEAAGEGSGRLTMPGNFMGTFDYVAPEQAVDAHEVDGRCDVYSLGCTLHYLLRGQPPYRRENAALILLAHCQDPIPKLQEKVAGVPDRLEALYQRMLAKKAADRVSTMTEVAVELEACLQELKGGAKSVNIPPAQPPLSDSALVATESAMAEITSAPEEPQLAATADATAGVPDEVSLASAVAEVSRDSSVGPGAVFSGFSLDEIPPSTDELPVQPASAWNPRDWRLWVAIVGAAVGTIGIAAAAWMAFGR